MLPERRSAIGQCEWIADFVQNLLFGWTKCNLLSEDGGAVEILDGRINFAHITHLRHASVRFRLHELYLQLKIILHQSTTREKRVTVQ